MAADEAGLRLSTAAGDFTLPLLAAERQNAQRANVQRANVQRANAQAFEVTAPFTLKDARAVMPDIVGHAASNPQSGGLPYATFFGGGADEQGASIAVNSAGEAYVTGVTTSLDFPASPGYDTSPSVIPEAFVVKLNAAGTGLLYATFLGGSSDDYGSGIAVDNTGEVYVVGATASPDFPASVGSGYDTTHNDLFDAYVVKLNDAGTALRYATFLGGSDDDLGLDIAVDSTNRAYVTGYTESGDFPASLGPGYDTTHNGARDVFIVKLDAAGTALCYATFLGGSADEEGFGIAVDGAGQAYVTGYTWSAGFPASLGPGYDTSLDGPSDAFVVNLDATGAALLYATFLGGSSVEGGRALAVDDARPGLRHGLYLLGRLSGQPRPRLRYLPQRQRRRLRREAGRGRR